MGFPLGYSELLLPKLLLQLVFLLGFIRRLISWAFNLLGLGDLLDSDSPWPADSASAILSTHTHPPQFHSVSAMIIQESLPVVRFRELSPDCIAIADSCAVCLYEFQGQDEVRRLSNCRHVFHMACLDRWTEHDQRTCPLCRTPLIPEELQDELNDKIWAAAGIPDSYISTDFDPFSHYSISTTTPPLLRHFA